MRRNSVPGPHRQLGITARMTRPGQVALLIDAAAFGLLDPQVTGLFRFDVEAQVAALVDDLAADARRAIQVDEHELGAGVGV